MLPAFNGLLNNDFIIAEQSSNTFYLDTVRDTVYGYTDGIAAMKQAIYLALSTERYRHVIFSRNYGVELDDLIGEPASYAIPEIQRRIEEALTQDTRISGVDGFDFRIEKNKVIATFSVTTIYGAIPFEKAVTI